MKKLLATLTILLFTCYSLSAQNGKYIQEMTSAIQAMNSLDRTKPDASAIQELANRFERIASAETQEWLPKYYAAFCYIMLGIDGNTLSEKDQFLDKAKALLQKSETLLDKANDELLVMMALETQIRLAADAMNRWQTEGEKFAEYIAKAKNLNPDNPRIYYLEGTTIFYTPEDYGGGKKAAKPLLEKAIQKFSNFKPESAISPNWGKVEAESMLIQSNQ